MKLESPIDETDRVSLGLPRSWTRIPHFIIFIPARVTYFLIRPQVRPGNLYIFGDGGAKRLSGECQHIFGFEPRQVQATTTGSIDYVMLRDLIISSWPENLKQLIRYVKESLEELRGENLDKIQNTTEIQ